MHLFFNSDPHSHSKKKDYDFTISDKPIGKGGYSEVRLARWHPKNFSEDQARWLAEERQMRGWDLEEGVGSKKKGDKESVIVAVKVVKKELVKDTTEYMKILGRGESRLYRHPKVCFLLDWFASPTKYYLTFPVLMGGELLDRLNDNGRFTEEATRRVLHTMLDIIIFLHRSGLIHRDIKPDNFLYRREDSAIDDFMIIDFGISKVLGPQQEGSADFRNEREVAGTPGYAAPEVFFGEGYGKNCDVFGVGVIAYNLLSATSPWKSREAVSLIRETARGGVVFPERNFAGVSKEAIDFVKLLMQTNPSKRPSSAAALAHPWLQKPYLPLSTSPTYLYVGTGTNTPIDRPSTMKPDDGVAKEMTMKGGVGGMDLEGLVIEGRRDGE